MNEKSLKRVMRTTASLPVAPADSRAASADNGVYAPCAGAEEVVVC
jgi:hypothetical protein